jgi:hypothetical protein
MQVTRDELQKIINKIFDPNKKGFYGSQMHGYYRNVRDSMPQNIPEEDKATMAEYFFTMIQRCLDQAIDEFEKNSKNNIDFDKFLKDIKDKIDSEDLYILRHGSGVSSEYQIKLGDHVKQHLKIALRSFIAEKHNLPPLKVSNLYGAMVEAENPGVQEIIDGKQPSLAPKAPGFDRGSPPEGPQKLPLTFAQKLKAKMQTKEPKESKVGTPQATAPTKPETPPTPPKLTKGKPLF